MAESPWMTVLPIMIKELNNGFILFTVEGWAFRKFRRSMLEVVVSIVVLSFWNFALC
jgi:uncharacterized membrane protein (Fun14 family)